MTWDLATAKTRLGITGTAQDAMLTAALGTALAVAESYCDRKFMYAAETATFTHVSERSVQLPRYPLEQVISATGGGSTVASAGYHVIKGTGQIEFHGWGAYDTLTVDYAGGYKTLPADLELALWLIFDGVWPMVNVTGGGAAAAPSTAVVESVTLADVGTVRFATGAAAQAATGAGGMIPVSAVGLLDKYRAASPIGVG